MRKVKNKRQKTKYSAVDPQLNLKSRYEEIMDIQEYFNTLSDKDKKWMNKFTEEYVNANLKGKTLKENLHDTKKLKKSCYDRNNSRNRDAYTKSKMTTSLYYIEDLKDKELSYEDDIIGKIDSKKKLV